MDDDELRQLREARMQELKSKQSSNQSSGQPDKNEEMRASVLAQLLSQAARERLNRVRIVKPERASQVEQILVNMAQTGQLSQRVEEPQLKTLLDKLAQQEQQSSKIVISRKDNSQDFQEPPTHQVPASTNEDSDSDFFD